MNTDTNIWDDPEYPWGEDLSRDLYKIEYDERKTRENGAERAGIALPMTHQSSSEMVRKMKQSGIQLPARQQPQNGLLNINALSNKTTEQSETNPDGSLFLTRSRQSKDNGTLSTHIGRIRLMPQDETAAGAHAVVGTLIKDQLFDLSENKGGAEILVNSGTRTPAQNSILVSNGQASPNSAHLSANAADISINSQLGALTAADAFNSGLFSRVNAYSDGRVHVDNLPRPPGSTGYYKDWYRIPFPRIRTKPIPPRF